MAAELTREMPESKAHDLSQNKTNVECINSGIEPLLSLQADIFGGVFYVPCLSLPPSTLSSILPSVLQSAHSHAPLPSAVNQIAISQYWSQGLVSHRVHIFGSISIQQDGSPRRLAVIAEQPRGNKGCRRQIKNPRLSGGDDGTDQHVTGPLRPLL
ncbi:unnamed protein product [Pleuronectes platessa]|uniref:Uncharacterized protein n=1 Tax=Pleuronectes platessa TaxID=8262 RepID=A0A9N7TMK7_PLEPL|nr:unnamed protein product [Pleuronectes platessa]